MFCSYLKNPYYWKLYSFYEIIGIFVLFCIYIFKVFEYIVFCKYILFVNVFDIFEKFNFCCWKSWYFCANILKKKICFDFFWKFQENKYFRKCWHFLKKIKILERLRLVQFVFFSPLKKKKTNKQFWSIFRGKMFWALLHVQNFIFPNILTLKKKKKKKNGSFRFSRHIFVTHMHEHTSPLFNI